MAPPVDTDPGKGPYSMKERRRVFGMIFDSSEQENITAAAGHFRDIAYEAAQEAKLYGAALMFEL